MPDNNDAMNAALINAGTAIATTAGASYSANANDKKARAWNEQMYKQSRADALSDWNMQNEYNSPKAQMERLKAAGLNPNLVYGNGNAMPTAANVKPSEFGSYHPETPNFDFSSMGGVIQSYFDNQVKTAQSDNLKATLGILEQEKLYKAAQTVNVLADTDLKKFDFGLKTDLRDVTMEGARANLNMILANIAGREASTKFTIDENQRQAAMQQPKLDAAVQQVINMKKQAGQIDAATAESWQRQYESAERTKILREQWEHWWKNGRNPNQSAQQQLLTSIFDAFSNPDSNINKGADKWMDKNPWFEKLGKAMEKYSPY